MDVLTKRASLDHSIASTTVDGLSVLTSGTIPTDTSELLRGPQVRELLATLAQRFDLVIVDTPPVLAVADAAILATLTDGVVFVVRAGKTNRTVTQHALQQLANVGARVIGAVLNDPSGEAARDVYPVGKYEYSPETTAGSR